MSLKKFTDSEVDRIMSQSLGDEPARQSIECPTLDSLWDYVSGENDTATFTEWVESHLQSCPSCHDKCERMKMGLKEFFKRS